MLVTIFTAHVRHSAVNACLVPLCSVDGQAITTVEGIGSTRTKLHTLQVRSFKLIVIKGIQNVLCESQ